MKAAEVFNKAADILDERGWGQGTYFSNYNELKGCCILGACMLAVGQYMGVSRVPRYILDDLGVMALFRKCGYAAPAQWNDVSGRNKEEVQGLLRDLAASNGDVELGQYYL